LEIIAEQLAEAIGVEVVVGGDAEWFSTWGGIYTVQHIRKQPFFVEKVLLLVP